MDKTTVIATLLNAKPFLKVIAGIENFDENSVKALAQAADTQAIAIDLAVDEELIKWVKANTSLLVFVSSLNPSELAKAVEWGADLLELGNFDPLYKRGETVTSDQVLAWTRELQQLTQGQVPLCITIPGKLEIEEQIDFAQQVQAAGADLLQVENVRSGMEHASLIQKAVELPLLLSGRLDETNLSEALATGVAGVGIGASIRAEQTIPAMQAKIQALQVLLQPVKARP